MVFHSRVQFDFRCASPSAMLIEQLKLNDSSEAILDKSILPREQYYLVDIVK